MHTPTQQKEEREKPLAWRHWQQRIKEMAATWKSAECIGENGHRMDAGNLYFTLMHLVFIVKNTNHVPLACLDSIPCHFDLKALSFLTLTLADRDL